MDSEETLPVAKKKSDIQLHEITNPAFVSESVEFISLIKKACERMALPTVRYESLHNHIGAVVQSVYDQKLRGVPASAITSRCTIGVVNGKMTGFSLFYMLPNRMPHIQTLMWEYCFAKHRNHPNVNDVRLIYKFSQEVQRMKKAVGARYITMPVAEEKFNKIIGIMFKKPRHAASIWVFDDVNDLGQLS